MERRDQILHVAGKLFSQRGYHATSMRELAKELNLQGGSLYAHIASKEELLLEVVRQAAARFLAVLEGLEGDPVAKVRALVRGHLRVIAEELPRATVFFHEWKHLSPPLLEEAKALRRRYEEGVQGVIQEGVEKGVFRVESVRLATLFLLSALNWTYQWYRPEGPLSPEELGEIYARMALRALGVKEGEDGAA
ncbi:MAG: TetR/AcrR family transcriptional regulator [Thermus sp.]|uniref:TetR/AcrR family transcriptional regulator n=1 Tax=Thermus sp. TaxID=275 RepID=UPI0025E762F6|nr:TetR/AcrR family transcriptional regulator [Thermus sp.]MCS6867827.1 TetR/AcrR family transcriptional regulator [Thermus sp.]MCS7219476.1 TetR/AcrR family transcriptional regulator [Thermus sp.]MCX7850003.1 TetR/AcrR family transcriptional regulator [Thermus sp.]MDW8018088.1 TetR/AcrR family transcriptional regulator [Thermus sp.]MDW8358315.1 TetR/AcrR family transcriptional regulator [Thermus sp.]